MNTTQQQAGVSTLAAAIGLGALPGEVYQRVVPALKDGATMEQMHEAARAIAEECPVTCLQGVVFALIFIADRRVEFNEQAASGGVNGQA